MTFRPIPMPSGSLPLAHPAMTALQAVGGAELNVAVAFARTAPKHDASFVTVLPRGALGYHVAAAAKAAGVSIDSIKWDEKPFSALGTLHVVDDGNGPRPHYQRHHSAFCSTAGNRIFDWPTILSSSSWLHVTALFGTRFERLGCSF